MKKLMSVPAVVPPYGQMTILELRRELARVQATRDSTGDSMITTACDAVKRHLLEELKARA